MLPMQGNFVYFWLSNEWCLQHNRCVIVRWENMYIVPTTPLWSVDSRSSGRQKALAHVPLPAGLGALFLGAGRLDSQAAGAPA